MDKLRIEGGRRLSGRVRIAGAKNAALPALAATLLTDAPVELENLPDVRDVRTMLRVLEQLGAEATVTGDRAARVALGRLASHEAPYELVRTMRASVLVLGPLVARHGRARVSLPGGCAIGERPIDLHLEGLRLMGAEVSLQHGYVEARAPRLHGASITFPQKTVTGTENLMMAATLARGTTVLANAACEPEVVDLAELLVAMGASIRGAGTDEIVIEGRPALAGAAHRVIPDRIEAGTYLVAGALTGELELVEVRPADLAPITEQLERAGVRIEGEGNRLRVAAPERLSSRDLVTAPHPGYPTDMQAQYMVLMTQAHGVSRVTEAVFEHRFMHVGELQRMGAEIHVEGADTVRVVGPRKLSGAQVMATDLRASACLVLGALVATGVTVLDRVYHLDRGYESMEKKLGALGASVERIR
jgi:UDP-N-acetylglucosamine 1-carboxyvinyltransferase